MRDQTVLFVRDATGSFLLFGAITKSWDWSNSVAALASRVGLKLTRRLLPVLVAVEAALGIALLAGAFGRIALVGGGLIFAFFAIVVAIWAATGVETSCACFGFGIPSRSSWFTAARNFLFACSALAAALFGRRVDGATLGLTNLAVVGVIAAAVAVPLMATSAGALDTIRATRRAGQRLGKFV
jgi:hypothetical protein